MAGRIIFYDLETTGTNQTSHIINIGAIDGDTLSNRFEIYMMPEDNRIPERASNVHGIYIKGNNKENHFLS